MSSVVSVESAMVSAQQVFGEISPQFARLTEEVLFGDVWQQGELSLRDRSLITVAALVALGRTGQLPFHYQLAQTHGVDSAQLSALITHLAFYAGWPAAASAFEAMQLVMESVCGDEEKEEKTSCL